MLVQAPGCVEFESSGVSCGFWEKFMMWLIRSGGLALLLSVAWLTLVSSAGAQINHGDVSGTDIDFLDITESIISADDDPNTSLYGTPTGVGNTLAFLNTNYVAQGQDGAADNTHALLNFTIDARDDLDPGDDDIITWISLSENGDTNLQEIGGTGSAATGVSMAVSGTITILETDSQGPIFDPINFIAEVTPAAPIDFTTAPDVGSWTATLGFDVTQYYPDATKVVIALDNDLWAFSETGTSARIQKKVAGVSIEVVPEPTTALLVGGGLVLLGLRSRRHSA